MVPKISFENWNESANTGTNCVYRLNKMPENRCLQPAAIEIKRRYKSFAVVKLKLETEPFHFRSGIWWEYPESLFPNSLHSRAFNLRNQSDQTRRVWELTLLYSSWLAPYWLAIKRCYDFWYALYYDQKIDSIASTEKKPLISTSYQLLCSIFPFSYQS